MKKLFDGLNSKISGTAIAISAPFFIFGLSEEGPLNLSYLGMGLLLLCSFNAKKQRNEKVGGVRCAEDNKNL